MKLLNPERYECAEHNVDLTEQVQEALEEDGPPLVYMSRFGPSPFQVVVRCPGAGGAGDHSLTCSGTKVL